MTRISLIVAMARNGVIGRGNTLPWRIPADLRHFKQLTMGHVLVMGRRTFESIGRPLPGRDTIVVTRQAYRAPEGVRVVSSIDAAFDAAGQGRHPAEAGSPGRHAAEAREVFVAGGAEIYALALPRVTRMHVTRVEADVDGDVRFPPYDPAEWRLIWEEPHPADPDSPYPYRFQIFERLQPAAVEV